MKKYILSIIGLLFATASWASYTSKDTVVNNVPYKLYTTNGATGESNYAAIYFSNSANRFEEGESVVIPSEIAKDGDATITWTVTRLDYWRNNSKVRLTLPNTLTYVNFSYIYSLEALNLPDNSDFATFALSKISVDIDTLYIPASTTTVTPYNSTGNYGQKRIAAFIVAEGNTGLKAVDGVLFSKDGTRLVAYPQRKDRVSYTVPAGVTSIGDYAFCDNDKLEKVVLPSGLLNVGDYSFYNCGSLYECQLPASINTIGKYAFRDCNKYSLTGDFSALSSLTDIGEYAFYGCKLSLTDNTFTLPANLKTIGSYAFSSAFSGDNVTVVFPSTLGEAGSQVAVSNYAFNCYVIRAQMTDPVNSSDYAFYSVSKIYVPSGSMDTYKSKTGWSYSSNKLTESVSMTTDPTLVAPTITTILDEASSTVKVKFSTSTEGATIKYYVLSSGASDVDVAEWYTYNGKDSIDVSHGSTAMAVTLKDGSYSTISQYTVNTTALKCPTPSIITATNSTTMTMATSLDGGSIYYTTDGTAPSAKNGTLYTNQIVLDGNFTYKAVVVKSGMFNSEIAENTVSWFKCERPTVSYAAESPTGTTVKVTITGSEKDKFQYYRGSGDWLDYPEGGVIGVNQNSYFYVRATRLNYNNSDEISTYLYRSNITAVKPTIAIDQEAKTLTLTSEEGADIYYTLDGSTPSVKAEQKYTDVITLTGNCQVYAIAHKPGMFQSDQASTNINNWFTCADVTMTPAVVNGQAVIQLSTTTEGATIRYGINSRDYYSPQNNSEYTSPIGYNNGDRIYAIAMKEGYNNSNWIDKQFNYGDTQVRCAQPSISLDNANKLVTITTSETDGIIYYTLDGSTPTTESTKYTEPFTSENNCTVMAITAKDPVKDEGGNILTYYINSSVASATLEDWFRLQNVKFVPVLGSADGLYRLALESEEGATIEYGINTYGGTIYSDTIDVSLGTRVYAIARKEGRPDSYWSEFYISTDNYTVAVPTINTFSDTKQIVITSTEGSTIYYTLDGSDATTSSNVYPEGGFTIDGNYTVKAIATKEGMTTSSQSTRTISDWFKVSDIVMDIYVENDTLMCKLSTQNGEDGVKIYYNIGGYSNFNTTDYTLNAEYTGPFKVRNQNVYIYAGAMKDNYNNSNYSRSNYIYFSSYTCNTPEITARSADSTVVITCSTEGATIYYTRDGSDPEIKTKNKYTPGTVFKLAKNETFKALAVKDKMFTSGTASNSITNWFRCNNVEYTQVLDKTVPKMKLTSKDGAKIYYRIDGYDSNNLENDSVYKAPISVEAGHTVYAIAVKDGYVNSSWNSKAMDYSSYENMCTAPTIETNSETREVTISTVHDKGTIYYTLDGSTPTASSSKYTKVLKPTVNCTIKAIVTVDTLVASTVAESGISWYKAENVVYNPIYEKNEDDETIYKLTLKSPTSKTKIYYGIDGYDYYNPTSSTLYTDGDTITVEAQKTVYAVALRDGYERSDWNSFTVNDANYTVSTPSYTTDQEKKKVYLSSTDGATIYYTTDGTSPDTTSVKYNATKGIDVKANWTIKAMAVKDGMYDSAVREFNISGWYRVSDVIFEPVISNNEFKMKLKTNDGESGTTIYYKVGGYYDFDQNDLKMNETYNGTAFSVGNGQYVSAIAVKENWTNSGLAREYYNYSNYTCSTPTISLNSEVDSVTFRCSTDNAKIYYTLDGSDPTTSETRKTTSHNKRIKLTTNCTIKAYATATGLLASSTTESTISSWFQVSDLVYTPIIEDNQLKMKLTTKNAESGVVIYYYVGGWSDFDQNTLANNNVYTEPFVVRSGTYVSAMATKTGYNNSSFMREYYDYGNYTCATPSITTNNEDTTATIRCTTADAVIYYTLDESDPVTSTTRKQYTGALKLTSNGTINAVATKKGVMMNSSMSSAVFNGLRVANPEFTLNGTKMTITTTTPGAVIYYAFGEENNATNESNRYSGPFELPDNRRVSAIAVRSGWNDSNSRYYYPNNVVQCPVVKQESFDGHYMTLSTIEGATIYYRTDGQAPYNWNGSTEYTGPIEINQTGTITARAYHPYMNDSEMASFKVDSYAGETGATTIAAGGLETSMAWSNPETIKEFAINGPANDADIKFIKDKMTSLEKLDLSAATMSGASLPDNAFAGMPLVHFISPNALTSIGKNIFSGCKELAAVDWKTTAKIPNDAFDNNVNPNLLLFVPAQNTAPDNSAVRNVIVNGTAQNIYLSDGENNNFYSPKQFYTQNITYTHEFKFKSGDGSGWETIALPFDCSRFVHETKGELTPFAVYNDSKNSTDAKPFWLRELTDIGFQDVRSIVANKPYIICMPNNEKYATRYRVAGKVTFSASNVNVPQTIPGESQKGDVTLYSNFINNSDTEEMLLLNTEATDDYEEGSIFVLNSGRAVRPFEAYVLSKARSRRIISLGDLGGDGENGATGIKDRSNDDADMVKVYNLSGVLVKQGAKEDALKGLAKGVYIVNGKRMIVK